MNKYQYLKYAVIGLNVISQSSSVASFFKPELRTFTQWVEPTKQVLIKTGNAYWNYELTQQPKPNLRRQEVEKWINLSYGD